jgi:hypothetical protein
LQTANGYDELPPDVVDFRRGLIDRFWDSRRFELFGDETCGDPDAFVGTCPDCNGQMDITFHATDTAVKLFCRGNGCDVRIAHRLGLHQ